MWRDIEGYEGYYQVSDKGEVMCVERTIRKKNGVIQTRKARLARVSKDKNGYLVVKLSKNGKSKYHGIHRLVAKAFVKGYSPEKEVNHKDYDRTNNSACNLEWVTHCENIRHSSDAGHYRNKEGALNPNYGNRSLSQRYKVEPTLKRLQSRPGEQNGRCVPVTMDYNGNIKHFPYLGLCARELILSGLTRANNITYISTKISSAMRSGKQYLGRTFY